jgi:hypothetical protein
MTGPLAAVPLSAGELRIVLGEGGCDVQQWRRHEGGRTMMSGGLKLTADDLRLALHALRVALWALEHPRRGELETPEQRAA